MEKLKHLSTVVVVVFVMYLFVEYIPARRSSTFYRQEKASKYKKVIRYWGDMWGREDFYFGFGDGMFQKCEYKACTVSRDTSPETADAIIFHGPTYNAAKYPPPAKRNPNQIYIFYCLEPPFKTKIDPTTFHNFYNLTMTYRSDSDVYAPYAEVLNGNNKKMEKHTIKNKMIAWLVSNCKTESKREKYVQELQKFVSVDIYGKCGDLFCAKEENCLKMIEDEYMFYLSFENALCEDYVTEKLFNVLKHDIVPIVYGSANYSNIAPPNSYIDILDFQSPEVLAEYLIHLSNSYRQYLRYFDWKSSYTIDMTRMCNLCKTLHEKSDLKSYENITSWWFGQNNHKCVKPDVINF